MLVILLSEGVVAAAYPNITSVLSLVGSTTGTFQAWVVPAFYYIRIAGSSDCPMNYSRPRLGPVKCFLAFAVVMMGVLTAITARSMAVGDDNGSAAPADD